MWYFVFSQLFKNVAPLSYLCIVFYEEFSVVLILDFLYIMHLFSVAAFKNFYSSLILRNFVLMCFSVVFFIFLVLGIHWASWICEFIVFIKNGIFSAIISSNSFSVPPPAWIHNYLYFRMLEVVLSLTDGLSLL